MKKDKIFENVKFTPEAIHEAWGKMDTYLTGDKRKHITLDLSVDFNNENWTHDKESEYFADYIKDANYASYRKSANFGEYIILVSYSNARVFYRTKTKIAITAPERSIIEEIHQIFETYAPKCIVPEVAKPKEKELTIFIGHGRSDQWRELKDHLHDKHSYNIEAYEVGARAGHAVRDILEEMLSRSSFAILVMTGEDKDEKGNLRARDNVIHELGLFQGKLGFSRAIILLEEGTQEFSNISGIQQIRYSKNKIIETFGEVLATLKREFENKDS